MTAAALQVPAPVPPSVVANTPALDDEAAETLATAVDAAQRMTVNVFVNGRGPYPFAVDTGSDRTAVARSLSDRLALPKGKSATMHSMGGSGQIGTAVIASLQVGGNEVRDVRAPVLADRHIGVSGLLGVDGLADQRVEMDFIAGNMKIYPSKIAPEKFEPGTIVVKARRKYGQLILVDADIDGEKVSIILDSGAQVSVGNNALRKKLSRKGKQGSVQQITLMDVAGNSMEAEMGVLPRMRIGGLRVEGMTIAWTEAHPFKMFGLSNKPAMLLGMDLLRSFERVSVDFGNKKVRFMPREQGRRGLAAQDPAPPPAPKDVAG
ncbi:retroviral-like aspartic protease family protein [Sphingomonas sp. DBB INV C78]|uniref:retroviral-like aspartic protease family protein n=1 Tax=Sphingomonas sp. DBB INV C78 TaxID=3349434 RepID=UPI0036D3B72B